MLNNVNTNVEHIIAKLDNDFNIDTSDYIPRVAAWVIEALSQMNALRKTRKRVQLNVQDRIVYSTCPINSPTLIVTDINGCTISKQKSGSNCNTCSSTGKVIKQIGSVTPNTVGVSYNSRPANAPDLTVAETVNGENSPARYNIHNYNYDNNVSRNYILIDENKLELTFDADCIYVETDWVETVFSPTYECELPVIPNVGILIEAVANYCMYKMLCRGLKHPMFNLAASQYGTNPYYEYNKLKGEAKRSVIIDEQGNINVTDGNLFQSAFFITMFK